MATLGLLEAAGAQPRNPSKGKALHVARMETGLFTNRSALHDPANFVYSRFYGGFPDALIDGSNMEITNALTIARRPGLSPWSTYAIPDAPNWFYDWRTLSYGIQVVIDTPVATYIQSDPPARTFAISQEQIFTKSPGGGQGYYQGVGDILYYGDGTDLQKFIFSTLRSVTVTTTTTTAGGTTTTTTTSTVTGPHPGTPTRTGPAPRINNITSAATAAVRTVVSTGATPVPTTAPPPVTTTNTVVSIIPTPNPTGTTQNPPPGSVTTTTTSTSQSATVSNWGIVGPASAPSVTPVQSAVSAVSWTGSPAVLWSTMGLLLDQNNNIEQLISVNASQTNTTHFGTTGNGQPQWTPFPGSTVADPNGWLWTNFGPIVPWRPGVWSDASFGGTAAAPCIIYDPKTKYCYIANTTNGNQSGASYPNFNKAIGQPTPDGQVRWFALSPGGLPQTWQPNTTFNTLGAGGNGNLDATAGISEPSSLNNGLPTTPTIYWWVNDTGQTQTTGASTSQPAWSKTLYTITEPDGDNVWLNLGSATRVPTNVYTPWTANGTGFSAISDPTTGTFQVCTAITGDGAASATPNNQIAYGTTYGASIIDGNVTWTCVGGGTGWTPNTRWYLPALGWFPPGGAVQYGGAVVLDSNQNEQGCVNSGLGSTFPPGPSWATAPVGANTSDHNAQWHLIGPAITAGFATQFSHSWAYSYTARAVDDINNTTAQPNFYVPGQPGWPALGVPLGSGTGHVSTASPVDVIIGPNPGAVYTLTVPGSSDPQVDTITFWRTLDGGSDLFFLGEVPNKLPINGVVQTVTATDDAPDTALNQFISAPINGQNNPPPAGFKPMAYHFQRIWGAVGNFVYVSGGPDVLTGNPNESFDPLDFFEFPSPVTNIVPTSTGILIFLTSDIYAILGGPLFDTFFPSPMVPGVGLLHYNALAVEGAMIYMFTADGQFLSLDPNSGVQRMGGPIQDKLALFNPSTTYVTVHESGNDNCIIVADGQTGWYRLNPSQFPNGTQVWSPFATITGGCQAVLSIEVSPGQHRLLAGGSGPSQVVLQRDFGTYADNGVPYSCFFTMGSLNLVNPGQIAGLTFANIRATRTGTTPAVSFLLNEVAGTFTTFPSAQAYPWQIYGAAGQPTSLFSNAYYFRETGIPALAEHLQVKVAFPAEAFPNEVLSLTLFGVIEQSPEV
jgi:hypothetical protein